MYERPLVSNTAIILLLKVLNHALEENLTVSSIDINNGVSDKEILHTITWRNLSHTGYSSRQMWNSRDILHYNITA